MRREGFSLPANRISRPVDQMEMERLEAEPEGIRSYDNDLKLGDNKTGRIDRLGKSMGQLPQPWPPIDHASAGFH